MWRDHAACAGAPTVVFYPAPGKGGTTDYRDAARYCADCPVRGECEADAITTDRLFGAHGYRAGMTPDQRIKLVRHR